MILSEKILSETTHDDVEALEYHKYSNMVCPQEAFNAMEEIAWLAWKEGACTTREKFIEKYEKAMFISWYNLTMENEKL